MIADIAISEITKLGYKNSTYIFYNSIDLLFSLSYSCLGRVLEFTLKASLTSIVSMKEISKVS